MADNETISTVQDINDEFKWPEPLIEDFNESIWPTIDLFSDCNQDENIPIKKEISNLRDTSKFKIVEKWVLDSQKIYIRLVTWNLAAKPPPPIDLVTVNLLPKNRSIIVI